MRGFQASDAEVLTGFRAVLREYPGIGQNKYDSLVYPGKPGRQTILRRFGSWAAAVKLAMDGEPVASAAQETTQEELTEEYTDDTGQLTSKSTRISTLGQLLEAANVNQEIWEVERYVVNKWEVGAKDSDGNIKVSPLYQVKAWLKKKKPESIELAMRAILQEIKEASPFYPSLPAPSGTGEKYMYEICIFDLHLAKLAWAQETGEDYDTAETERRFMFAISDLVRRAYGLNLERIDIPTGNDFFHVDNLANLTTAGTRQDVDSRWQRAFQRAIKLLINTVLSLAEIAPVNMPIIPGNHDWERMFYLGEALKQRFHGSDRITIDNSPNPRKYTRYGINLIGYTHGKDEKPDSLPLIMATEQPEHWAQTKFREWHIGHFHKSREVKYLAGDTHNGVSVRTIPSLCGTDAWHHAKGYVKGTRAAEGYLWGKETGYAGHFSSNVVS